VSKIFQGFKDFIMRGNVVDLAVGIVIGAAFTAVVTGFTKSFLEPLIIWISGGSGELAGVWSPKKGVDFTYATFINSLITFLLTAAVLYFLVVFPLNKLAERRKRGEEPPSKAPSEEVQLLTEIRDALLSGGQPTPAGQSALNEVLGRQQSEGRHQEPPR
jgi:large conductance mechanosensitive channel